MQNLDRIAQASTNGVEWPQYYRQLHEIGHLNISTITKLAYFHKLIFQGHRALILDQRVIDALAAGHWDQLHIAGLKYDNSPRHYLEYLKQIATVSAQIHATPDQVEFILFSWGDIF